MIERVASPFHAVAFIATSATGAALADEPPNGEANGDGGND
jgi:hypothetical protein